MCYIWSMGRWLYMERIMTKLNRRIYIWFPQIHLCSVRPSCALHYTTEKWSYESHLASSWLSHEMWLQLMIMHRIFCIMAHLDIMQCNTGQGSAEGQYSALQCSAVQCSAVQCIAEQCSALQRLYYNTVSRPPCPLWTIYQKPCLDKGLT